jgi:hypothetical protein
LAEQRFELSKLDLNHLPQGAQSNSLHSTLREIRDLSDALISMIASSDDKGNPIETSRSKMAGKFEGAALSLEPFDFAALGAERVLQLEYFLSTATDRDFQGKKNQRYFDQVMLLEIIPSFRAQWKTMSRVQQAQALDSVRKWLSRGLEPIMMATEMFNHTPNCPYRFFVKDSGFPGFYVKDQNGNTWGFVNTTWEKPVYSLVLFFEAYMSGDWLNLPFIKK